MIYEYNVADRYANQLRGDIEHLLNCRGRDGWELVAAFPVPACEQTMRFVFKRPMVSQPAGAVVDVTSLADRFRTLREIADDTEQRLMNLQPTETSQ